MKSSLLAGAETPFATLRRLAQPAPAAEQCEFCSQELAAEHRHLFEPATRKIICACDPCALRFENVVGRWKLIPRDATPLFEFKLSDADWDALALPIQLAFCFESTAAQRVIALYPSPAGATESLLPLPQWQALKATNPRLTGLQPDIEALLINRLRPAPVYWVAPIDLCFELVGRIRLHWRGLSGGEEVWREVEMFFANLDARATTAPVTERSAPLSHA